MPRGPPEQSGTAADPLAGTAIGYSRPLLGRATVGLGLVLSLGDCTSALELLGGHPSIPKHGEA